MAARYWIAFGIGCQVLFIPLSLLAGGVVFWMHSRNADDKISHGFPFSVLLNLGCGCLVRRHRFGNDKLSGYRVCGRDSGQFAKTRSSH
jgi:hypothetical protein